MRTPQKSLPVNIIPNPNVSFYEKWITSAIKGDASAEYKLAYFYLTGDGPEKDPQFAMYWFGRAANQGYVKAITHLGFCYQYGCHVCEDKAQAVNWYNQAAQKGDGFAQASLATCYEEGIGVDKNLKISLLAQQLGMSVAKDAIRCFHQNVIYLHHYLVAYAEYLFNTPLVLPKMVIINIGKSEGELQFTSYSKGFFCKTLTIEAAKDPRLVENGKLANFEISAKFNLIRNQNKLELISRAYTSNIKLVKTLFEIFCKKQLEKYQKPNHEFDEPDSPGGYSGCNFFGLAQRVSAEKKTNWKLYIYT